MRRNVFRPVLLIVVLAVFAALIVALARWVNVLEACPWSVVMVAVVAGAASMHGYSYSSRVRHLKFATAVGNQTDHMMIGAAETAFFIESVKKKVELDVATAQKIVHGTEENADRMEQIAVSAEQASQVAADVCRVSVTGRVEVDRGLLRITQARQEAETASAVITELKARARRITGITETINEIAARTNLLALNAAIEAARAGEYGRGFAVVANEVRMLAQRTRDATDEIGIMVRTMNEKAEAAVHGMETVTNTVVQASVNVEEIRSVLERIEVSASTSEQEILRIAAASRDNVTITHRLVESITTIRDGMLATEQALPRAGASAMQLCGHAESLFSATVASRVSSPHDKIRAVAQDAAAQIGQLFSAAIADGKITAEALFDRRYAPIANTSPQKHSSSFDAFTDRTLPALQEAILDHMPNVAYAGAVDTNGYFPTHNRKFSKPLTGNYDVDLANNRTKRIFSDRTGTRCGASTDTFLLQTYKRDTGEVMHDLSVPIYVGERHWGGFRIGYRSVEVA